MEQKRASRFVHRGRLSGILYCYIKKKFKERLHLEQNDREAYDYGIIVQSIRTYERRVEASMKSLLTILVAAAILSSIVGCKKSSSNPVQTTVASTWVPINIPFLEDSTVEALSVSGDTVFAVINGRVYRSMDAGNSWTLAYSSSYVNDVAQQNNLVLAGSDGIGTIVSKDGGATWSASNIGIQYNVTKLDVYRVAMSGERFFAGMAEDGMFMSSDQGQTWTHVLADTVAGIYQIEGDGLTVYVAIPIYAIQGRSLRGGLLESTDNGTKFTSTGLYDTTDDGWAFANRKGHLLVAGMNGMYRSNDNGTVWSKIMQKVSAGWIIALRFVGDTLYLGTDQMQGIQISTNYGDSWSSSSDGLNNLGVTCLAASEKYVFAGTNAGVYRRTR